MRGVNKLILDIKDTENEFFDRAILFLKTDKTAADQSMLNENAERFLSAVKLGTVNKRKRLKIALIVAGAVLAVAGVLVLILI